MSPRRARRRCHARAADDCERAVLLRTSAVRALRASAARRRSPRRRRWRRRQCRQREWQRRLAPRPCAARATYPRMPPCHALWRVCSMSAVSTHANRSHELPSQSSRHRGRAAVSRLPPHAHHQGNHAQKPAHRRGKGRGAPAHDVRSVKDLGDEFGAGQRVRLSCWRYYRLPHDAGGQPLARATREAQA